MSDSRRALLNAALGVLVLALAAVCVLVLAGGWKPLPAQEPTAAEKTLLAYDEALATAEEWTAEFLRVDHKAMDPIFKRVLAGTAPPFRDEYQRSEANLKQLARANQSVSTGEVLTAGVSELKGGTAKVFVAANSRVQNKSTKAPQTRYYRIELQLVRQGGNWLISNLKFVG